MGVVEGVMAMSESQRALEKIEVPSKGLPKTWPQLAWAREKRQRRERNSRIYRDWLAADDKKKALVDLAGRWGLPVGRICSIIEKMKSAGAVVPHMAAEVEVLRRVKTEQTLADHERWRVELEAQIMELEAARDRGEKVAIVEETDDDGKLKEKRRPINKLLKDLKGELAKSHDAEGDALGHYVVKPAQQVDFRGKLKIQADEEFAEEFARLRKIEDAES
jgi:hypothetical protein